MKCKNENKCTNFPDKCNDCKATSDIYNHHPFFKDSVWHTEPPKTDKPVLCWYEYFRYGDYNAMYQTYGIGYYFDGKWNGDVAYGNASRVLAWTELPEPPREDSL